MNIKILCDDTAFQPEYCCEHGFSALLTTKKHCVLFDVGQTDVFAQNAKKLGVDLSQVDTVILSHGHYDHCNGLLHFLKINSRAKIFLHRTALKSFWHDDKYIGIDAAIKKDPERYVFVDKMLRLDDELSIYLASDLRLGLTDHFFVQEGEKRISDSFDHEMYLLCTQKDAKVLFTGCAHRGIDQIASLAFSIGAAHLVGGFHISESWRSDELRALARRLAAYPIKYYTGHCTSEKALGIMREIDCRKFVPLGAGKQFALGSHGDVACALFRQGYNCSQAVLGAFAEDLGLDMDIAMKLSSSFGGGMGRMREVCGAVSGMLMVCGLLRGYDTPETGSVKADHYRLVQEMASEFRQISGSIICRDLLGGTASSSPTPSERTFDFYQKRPCERLIYLAASLAEKYCL